MFFTEHSLDSDQRAMLYYRIGGLQDHVDQAAHLVDLLRLAPAAQIDDRLRVILAANAGIRQRIRRVRAFISTDVDLSALVFELLQLAGIEELLCVIRKLASVLADRGDLELK